MDVTYKIRQIKKTDDKDFVTLIRLYNDNINPAIKTSPNEIQYWLDNFDKRPTDDTFWILALYMNNVPIGFSQMIHFFAKKVLFIDYCVIAPNFRGRTFSEFIYLIRDFFIDKEIEINFYITEAVYYSRDQKPSNNAIKFIRLLKMSGFWVIKAPYSQPELGLGNRESEMKATLMIHMNGRDNDCMSIHKETYLDLIQTIFYDHYIAWYKPFMKNDELQIYTQKINLLYKQIQIEMNNKENISLNGEPYFIQGERPSERNKNSNVKTVIAFLCSAIMSYVVILIISLVLNRCFEFPAELQFHNWKITGVLTLVIFIAWLYRNEDLSGVIRKWVEKKR